MNYLMELSRPSSYPHSQNFAEMNQLQIFFNLLSGSRGIRRILLSEVKRRESQADDQSRKSTLHV